MPRVWLFSESVRANWLRRMIEVDWTAPYISERRRVRGGGAGRSWLPEDLRMLVAARQFSCTQRGAGAICAYCTAPITSETFSLGFEEMNGKRPTYPAELDHITPKVYTGEDELLNFQYLCKFCNQQKLDNITFHVVWQEERMGNTIEGAQGFWPQYDIFLDVWRTEKRLMSPIPYWMKDASGAPHFFGINEQQRTISKQGSLAAESRVLAENIRNLQRFYRGLGMADKNAELGAAINKYTNGAV